MKKLMFLSLAIIAAPLFAQKRVDILVDVEGVHRTGGSATYAPNTMRFEPSFRTGAGFGIGLNFFLTDRVSLEGKVAAMETPMRLRIVGRDSVQIFNLGNTKFYPLSAVVQWHPVEHATFRPYVGAGVVYTIMSGVNKSIPGTTATSVDFDNPTGLVADFGLETSLGSKWSLFGDARYVPLETRSKATFVGTASTTSFRSRPLVVSFGVAYHH